MNPFESMDDETLGAELRASLRLQDAPKPVLDAALAIWREAHSASPSAAASPLEAVAHAVRRVRAALTFDSWTAAPAALGLRSGGNQARHLMFSADGRDIDLRIVSSAESYVLAGQILGPDERGAVQLTVDTAAGGTPAPARAVPLDDLGSFQLEAVNAGTYWMTLKFADEWVELPAIVVGERRAS